MQAIITVGLGFGDEGKGAAVDHLTRETAADLVVRYSGGGQAGHNVVLADGRRHAFAQFGAGTFAGARTWLGPRMIISPATMVPEADHLRSLGVADPFGLLSVHPDCLVSTAYHVAMNRLRELARGDGRHGSCGLGIGETRNYWFKHGPDAITAGDLNERQTLIQKLTLLRERMLLEMQELPRLDRQWSALMHQTWPAAEADVLRRSAAELQLAREMPACHTVIFEGAQGVLLDEWHGFHPYTTWSTVTPLHAWELIADCGIRDVTVLGLTRAYATRHGAGPFPTFSPEMTAAMADPGNPDNAWQGTIRSGPLDLVLLDYAARICKIDALAVTCLDRLPRQPQLARRYAGLDRLEIPTSLHDQAELTKLLETARPVIETTTEAGLIATLEQIAPLRYLARGPRSGDWQRVIQPAKSEKIPRKAPRPLVSSALADSRTGFQPVATG
jgi:adenylosuccinate synthase